MPPFSAAARRAISKLSFGFRDLNGDPGSTSFTASAAATDAEVAAVAAGLGNMSNARLMESHRKVSSVQINPNNALNSAFDDVHGTVDKVGIMLFQNDTTGEVRRVGVPAIDASFFTQGGKIFIEPDGAATAGDPPELLDNSIVALLAVFGAGWNYVRGYLRGSNAPQNVVIPVVEPTGNPPDEPGV